MAFACMCIGKLFHRAIECLSAYKCVFFALPLSLFNAVQEWNDMNLRWNTSEYGGVKDLRIPPHRLWKPGMVVVINSRFSPRKY